MLKTLFGSEGGCSKREIRKLSERESFSNYLPWLFYHDEKGCFLNADNSLGYLWQCQPMTYLGEPGVQQLEAILNAPFPKGTVLQVILFADPYVDRFIHNYQNNKVRQDALAQKNVDATTVFLKEGTKGLEKLYGVPVRDFKLWIALKSEKDISQDEIALLEESLKAAGLCPARANAEILTHWMRRLFSELGEGTATNLDAHIPIRKQIIKAEHPVCFTKEHAKVGARYARCITPKANPETISALRANKLVGGLWGLEDDTNQITCPFMLTLNVVFDDLASGIHQKANLTMAQKATGSFAKQIKKRLAEFDWALDKLEKERFVRIMPSLWLFEKDEVALRQSTSRAKRLWENQHFVMQEEVHLNKVMLIASLPFGLYTHENNLKIMDRDFVVPASTAARFLPVQADFRGTPNPVLPLIGRKGQVIGLDLFDKSSNNHNFLVVAQSGSGKSFSLNYLCSNYYAAGELIRIIDIGYSYKKLAQTCRGRFLDFGAEKITINPFDTLAKDTEDSARDRVAAVNVIAEMAYASSGANLSETEWSLIKEAVIWTFEQGNKEDGIDSVANFLSHYQDYADADTCLPETVKMAKTLAFNLKDFKTGGIYGRFFNGKSTFQIQNDDFVVLELEELRSYRELFRVIVMQVMNAVTQDLYLSDRSQRRFILFEEAAQFLNQQANKENSRLSSIIDEGYRRARKYQGAFGVVLQSLQDLKLFGGVGEVIRANSAYKFYLQNAGLDDVWAEGSAFKKRLASSVKNNKPRYSELLIESPQGLGVSRLVVDPWTYWTYTSEGKEVHQFNALVEAGLSPLQAIEQLSGIRAPMHHQGAAA